ncbi:MAG: hypothetical protein ACFFAS_05620 [Promethearchaeota archaeon]
MNENRMFAVFLFAFITFLFYLMMLSAETTLLLSSDPDVDTLRTFLNLRESQGYSTIRIIYLLIIPLVMIVVGLAKKIESNNRLYILVVLNTSEFFFVAFFFIRFKFNCNINSIC